MTKMPGEGDIDTQHNGGQVLRTLIRSKNPSTLAKAIGEEVLDADVRRLWPLSHKHLNFLGRYCFTLSEPVLNGQLRPLNTPEDLKL